MMNPLEAIRKARQDRKKILWEAGVREGMRVADVGAGYGYFALPAASMIGPQGELLAVEPDPKRAREIAERAKSERLQNVRVVQSKAEEMSQIATGTVDLALVMSSFHHMADRRAALKEIRRVLKPGGGLYVRELKAGKVFRHGSKKEEFQSLVGEEFPGARFDETRGFLFASSKAGSS